MSEYTDLRTLEDGTAFYVVNGNWDGYIFVKDDKKYVHANTTGTDKEITGNEQLTIKIKKRAIFTDGLKQKLCDEIKAGTILTDSDIEDFCDDHNLSWGEVFHWISVWTAPDQCEGCKHVDRYANMYPCNECKRAHMRDHYEREEEKDDSD